MRMPLIWILGFSRITNPFEIGESGHFVLWPSDFYPLDPVFPFALYSSIKIKFIIKFFGSHAAIDLHENRMGRCQNWQTGRGQLEISPGGQNERWRAPGNRQWPQQE